MSLLSDVQREPVVAWRNPGNGLTIEELLGPEDGPEDVAAYWKLQKPWFVSTEDRSPTVV
jgi:hypothetical protein